MRRTQRKAGAARIPSALLGIIQRHPIPGRVSQVCNLEFDASNDLGEMVRAIQAAPFLARRLAQLEDHGEGCLAAEAALGLGGSQPRRGECAFKAPCPGAAANSAATVGYPFRRSPERPINQKCT